MTKRYYLNIYLCFLIAVFATNTAFLVIAKLFPARLSGGSASWGFTLGFELGVGGMLVGAAAFLIQRGQQRFLPLIAVSTIAVLSCINLKLQFLPLNQYGDAVWMQAFVVSGKVFSRWLGGTALLAHLYPLVGGAGYSFVAISGMLTMLAFTALLTAQARGQWRILLPMLTPIWFVFSSGYQEYYPFIAGFWLSAVFLISSERSIAWPWWGVSAGLLPLMYVGFWPVAPLLVIGVSRQGVGAVLKTGLLGFGIWLLGVHLCWPHGYENYFITLSGDLNLGEKNTVYPGYAGKSMSPYSPFFAVRYIFEPHHLLHIAYMAFIGLGMVLIASVLALPCWVNRTQAVRPIKRHWLFLLLLGWQLTYFLLMIPKLGPVQDFDLFFSVYLVLAAMIGYLLDQAMVRWSAQSAYYTSGFVAAIIGNSVVVFAHLVVGF